MDVVFTDLLTPGVPLLEKVLRSLAVYVFLVVALRLAGKRELGQLTTFDLIVLLLLSNTVQNAIIGDDFSLTGAFIGAVILLLVNYVTVRFFYRHQGLSRLVEGHPVILVDHGRRLPDNMARELITEDELLAASRQQGVERIEDVDKAILETNGEISVFPRHPTADETAFGDIGHRLGAIEALLQKQLTEHSGPATDSATGATT